MAEGMLVVWTDVDPAGEDDFEEWYNREHVNERAAIKGFLSGHRYRAIRGRPRYLALYEIVNDRVGKTPVAPSPLTCAATAKSGKKSHSFGNSRSRPRT